MTESHLLIRTEIARIDHPVQFFSFIFFTAVKHTCFHNERLSF